MQSIVFGMFLIRSIWPVVGRQSENLAKSDSFHYFNSDTAAAALQASLKCPLAVFFFL